MLPAFRAILIRGVRAMRAEFCVGVAPALRGDIVRCGAVAGAGRATMFVVVRADTDFVVFDAVCSRVFDRSRIVFCVWADEVVRAVVFFVSLVSDVDFLRVVDTVAAASLRAVARATSAMSANATG